MSGAVRLEELGIPGVLAVARGFEDDANTAADVNGMPLLRLVVIPGYIWGRQPREAKKPLAEAHFDELVEALLRPLSSEEKKPEQKKEGFEPIEIVAESYEAAVENFNQLFLDNRWGDGLPLIPPTAERVKWMLSGTSRSPDEVIGKVAPGNGIATVEKIAINAVMAGAKPEYLPVIIAALEGLTDENFDVLHMQASTGNFTLAIMVTGPIGKEIKMNSEIGYLGHGWRANNTIGRAVRLCLLNFGHVWPGVSDMANVGRPSPHTFYTFSENEDFSPWGPYHADRGFKSEDSCVTVSTVGGYGGFGVNHLTGRSAQELLNDMVHGISQNRRIFAMFRRGTANPMAHWSKHIFVLYPQAAAELHHLGFTREGLANYIYERTSIPYEEFGPDEVRGLEERIKGSIEGGMLFADMIPPDRLSVFQEVLKPGGKVPVLISPKDIHIVVAGTASGVPGSVVWFSYIKAVYKWTSHQTRLILGATLTKAGR
ncbi:MAG: UGSC family (seleno)protein [Thermodesulfobacteriota bacterium]